MSPWPAHGSERLPWRQSARSGNREDRMLSSVEATIPPFIAALDYSPTPRTLAAAEQATSAVSRADAEAAGHSAALSRFMIRSESVASSKIERINASAVDFARAIAGGRGNASATSMVAASVALHEMIAVVGNEGSFSMKVLTDAHRELMADDPFEASYAGRLRDMQNWIGGSDHSPRDALHVPPAPGRVEALLVDLIDYLNRDDIPVIVQAAIGHAQFESVHPFTDGNGRIGRALVGALMRRRGITEHAVVPLASGLLAKREQHFDALGAYRRGDPEPMIALFAASAFAAAIESRDSILRIDHLPEYWGELFRPRAGSVGAKLLDLFFDHPVMSSTEIEDFLGGTVSGSYAALDSMESAGILQEITGRKRNRVWVAADLLAELDDLDRRIQRAMR